LIKEFEFVKLNKDKELDKYVDVEMPFISFHYMGKDLKQNYRVYEEYIIIAVVTVKDEIADYKAEYKVDYYMTTEEYKDVVKILYDEFANVEFEKEMRFDKPVIYFYPEEEMHVQVALDFKGEITTSYPKYKDGWDVDIHTDGSITDMEGNRYSYLYWEGIAPYSAPIEEGFVVSGEETAEFLRGKLEELGLNYRESNDFITYWLPDMEESNYNLISFVVEEYEEVAGLKVTPEPDTMLRVFMVYKPIDEYVTIPEQSFEKIERKGFTIVEWGGGKY